jgi:hypothetical protein
MTRRVFVVLSVKMIQFYGYLVRSHVTLVMMFGR